MEPATEMEMEVWRAIRRIKQMLNEHEHINRGIILSALVGYWLSEACPHEREILTGWHIESARDFVRIVGISTVSGHA